MMQILLENPQLEKFLRDMVDSGQYHSPAAVIEAALSRLMAEDFAPGELDRMIDEAEANLLKHGARSLDEVFDALKERSKLARIRAGK
jgi:Arc/MetJ-type ribon-helix-helix transcriptional regulator